MPDALVERDGHTMVITMNRPKRYNALTGAMLVRMYDAMVEACADDDIRSIILTGAEGNFCSGADLRAMAGDAEDTDTEIDVARRAWPPTPTSPTRDCCATTSRRSRSSPRSRASPSPAAPRCCRAPTSASRASRRASA